MQQLTEAPADDIQRARQAYRDHLAKHPSYDNLKEGQKSWDEFKQWDIERERLFNEAMKLKGVIVSE